MLRGHWPRGRRRNPVDALPFLRSLHNEYKTFVAIAKLAGVTPTTVRDWLTGENRPTLAALERIVESVAPLHLEMQSIRLGNIPLRENDSDSLQTRVFGIGDYTRRASRGEYLTPDDMENCDEENT